MSPLRTAAFYRDEASRLRRLVNDCPNASLRYELLNRAAEFEELAAWAGDQQRDQDALVIRKQAPVIN